MPNGEIEHITVPKCILDPSRDCLGLQKAQMLEKQMDKYMTEAHGTHSEMFGRIIALEKSDAARNEQYNSIIDKLNTLQADFTKQFGQLQTELNKALITIAELKEKPAKRWENIVDKVIWLAIAAMLGYIATKVGLPV